MQVEAKMEMLVGVPAAVEDALASLLVDHRDPVLQARAPTGIRWQHALGSCQI